jgi:hypothetical protein
MKDSKEFKKYFNDMNKGIEKHTLTFSGWLIGVKKLSDEEISKLFDDGIRCSKLQKEYEKWVKI